MALANGPRVVAVTGAAGYVGRRLVAALLEQARIERVVALDVRPIEMRHDRLRAARHDITEPMEQIFASEGVEGVVHLAFVLRHMPKRSASHRVNVDGTANLLSACEATGVSRIVIMSSSTVYGAHRDNPPVLTEEALARPSPLFHYAWDKAEAERMAMRYANAHPEAAVSLLRMCVVMGPSADNFITAALAKPVLIGVRKYDPGLQFVHEDDVARLLVRFAMERHPGVYNVAGPGTVHWSEFARIAKRPMLWLPASLAYALTDAAWLLRLQHDSPGIGLDFIRWPWVVGTDKLERELEYHFQYTSEEALRSYLERGRRAAALP
ncbi:MAG: NAD-dependent epimerase/dehydratase family protein [SAR202 cluster bacterium]|nr:NAD-dependent epimerase/dehydratase family protein [SAR202 cluster bacterium]